MTRIKVRYGESLEQALRRFNREVQREGILKELRKREFFEKPSEVKARKRKERDRRLSFEKLDKPKV
ncbi:30S ribosomal protein S21 [candidate division WWE3 bacterium]|nr:30S ribosomal protein S21 [candidate division WWE3 bacterium]